MSPAETFNTVWFGLGAGLIAGVAFGRWFQWMRDAKYIAHYKEVEDQLHIFQMCRD